ncbi:kinase-like domain-containing protein [Pseudoneurospora amorphoporcata]|uniref:Kinase-like domain-containing protein n=1 Tax=Pseudoneurospora amorphoporcata TaxID=241081 RepID=A0AAN6NSK0_9PEZI|nr:kinase-like domain-containing protein [Pseudoneurospora amorphoporcata]
MSAARSENPAEIQVKIITKDGALRRHTEDRYLYLSGELFSVQINTEIGAKKADRIFRVINKLGYGTYGTVWLVEDTKPPANAPSRWKAIKMHRRGTADTDLRVLKEFKRAVITPEKALAEYQVAIPYEQFPIKGGPGNKTTYTCSVLPLLGPRVDNEGLCSRDGNDHASRFACRQIAEALQKLHKMGIAHGDFRPANILYYLPHLDKLSQDEIMHVYGQPKALELKDPTPMREPDHLVFPATCDVEALREILARKNLDMGLVGQPGLQVPRATVIDMGAAWHQSWGPRCTLIPASYRAPECIIRQDGYTSICMGHTAFRDNTWESVDRRPDTDVLAEMEFFLGPIPVPYRSAWKERTEGKNTVFPSNPAHVGFLRYKALKDWRKMHRRDGARSPLHLMVSKSELPKEKADMFLDLLQGIFKWFPGQRMSLEDILKHPFLQVSDTGPEQVLGGNT